LKVSHARTITWLLVGLSACLLLLANTAVLRSDTDYEELGAYRRLWSDLAVGVTGYLDAAYPVPAERASRKKWAPDPIGACRQAILEKIAQQEIRPWQFWRTVRDEPFLRERVASPPDAYDDPGRGLVLAAAFRARGGIAPFLILWLAPLFFVPVMLWIAFESFRAGVPVAGGAFLALLGLSPYVVESLSFARSAIGFYLVALLTVVPLALYGLLGPPPTRNGLAARWAGAGVVFGVAALCRSGALFALPALVLVLALSIARLSAPPRRRLLVALLGLTALLAPYALLRQPQHHDIWAAIWEGLGDFDRTRGHAWSDPVAEARVRREGATGRLSAEGMAVLRADVIDHVRDDPGWYAGILARRLSATVTQSRLWPSIRGDGLWMARSSSPNEGFMDKYYAYTTTVDFLGFGTHKLELPVVLMLLPTVGLLAWAAYNRRLRPYATVTLCLMAAAVPLPVGITTAGGVEPQAFALAYGLGFALLLDLLVARAID
jgi:hypothetical protein